MVALENVHTRLAEILETFPDDCSPTVFAVRSHSVAATLFHEGLADHMLPCWNTDSVEIARASSASVVLARYRAGHARPPRLVESDRHTTLLNLGPGSLDVLIYRTVQVESGTGSRRQLLGPIFRTLTQGEVLAAIAGQEIIDVIPAEETVVAWILSKPTHGALWEYDRQTGFCTGSVR